MHVWFPSLPRFSIIFKSRAFLGCHGRHDAPLVVWDCDVAANAQAWADRGVFENSSSYQLSPPAGPAGENIALGQATGTAATDDWYKEVSNWMYDPGDGTNNQGETGHFTAMIWKGVTKLGCGYYPSTNFWVCRYKAGDTLSADTPNMAGTITRFLSCNAGSNCESCCRCLQGQRSSTEC